MRARAAAAAHVQRLWRAHGASSANVYNVRLNVTKPERRCFLVPGNVVPWKSRRLYLDRPCQCTGASRAGSASLFLFLFVFLIPAPASRRSSKEATTQYRLHTQRHVPPPPLCAHVVRVRLCGLRQLGRRRSTSAVTVSPLAGSAIHYAGAPPKRLLLPHGMPRM